MPLEENIALNDDQKQAVEYDQGPLLIIAGAGTGKTRVLVEKIKHLINHKRARPEEILGLTFTEKAASEMEERVDKAIPYGYFQMWISTFHSFADQILKENATHIGLDPGFRLMTDAETILFLRQNLFLFDLAYFRPLGNPNKFLEALIQHFSRLRDEYITPEEYTRWVKELKIGEVNEEEKKKYEELANAYQKYQQLKAKKGLMDFSDLVFYLIQLYKKRRNILETYQKNFKYVLIDEFQDTNIAQYELIQLLCPAEKNPRLTIVGDDSQAIYKFRGASVSNILTFKRDYPKAKQITLRRNYRSNQTILDSAYRLIKHNDPDTLEAKLGISKQLVAQRKHRPDNPIQFSLAKSVEEEAEYVVNEIASLAKKQYTYSQCAILCRANNHSDPFIRALIRKGVPFQFLGPGMLLKQPEVKDLIAYLKVLNDLEDSVSLYRVLTMDLFEIDVKDISLLLAFSKRISRSLFTAIEIFFSFFDELASRQEFEIYRKFLPFLSTDSREKIKTIFEIIKRHLALIRKETAGQILYFFLEDAKYLSRLVSYKTEKEEKIALNISKFFNKLKSFETTREDASVSAVVEYLDMSMQMGESPLASETDIGEYNGVNILTVHSAKGLEFPIVFLVNLSRGRFPTYFKKETIPIPQPLIKEMLPEGDYHEEEERRLFYVGLTRAMDKVYLTASQLYGEGKRERKISPFVVETLGEEVVEKNLKAIKVEKEQLSIFDFKKTEEKPSLQKLPITHFSYSQIETYETCPLQYKYRYVLKIPTTPQAATSFGESVHKVLQKFYQEFLINPSLKKDRLSQLLDELWVPVGYGSEAHEKKMKKEARSMLEKFYDTYHHPSSKIIALEKLFKIKVDNTLYITGKIDRVDASSNNGLEIIDYKTGRKPAEDFFKKSLQLSIYALAATDKGLYNKKLDEVTLTFYYLQNLEKISMKRTPSDMKLMDEKIKTTVSQIRQSEFLPNVGPWCDFCAFRMICEAWQ